MRIVYLIENIDTIGGIQGGLAIRVNELVKKYNYKITIVCTNYSSKIPAYHIHESVEIIFLEKIQNRVSFIGRIMLRWQQSRMILKDLNPDILISVKYTLHNFFFKLIRSNTKLVSEMRETKQNYDLNKGNSYKSWIKTIIRNYVLRTQDLIIVLTLADKENWGYRNIVVVNNPKTIESEETSSLENKQVLAIGRLTKVKGFDKLLDVWKYVNEVRPQWILKICGAGEDYENLILKVISLKIENSVIITNKFVEVIPEFLKSSIFALTSQFESFGNVLVEAKVCGVPVIAFDVPNGPREIVDDGLDGFLIPKDDIKSMAKKIIYLMDNLDVRKEMGKCARENSNKYNVEIIMEKYHQSLLNIL